MANLEPCLWVLNPSLASYRANSQQQVQISKTKRRQTIIEVLKQLGLDLGAPAAAPPQLRLCRDDPGQRGPTAPLHDPAGWRKPWSCHGVWQSSWKSPHISEESLAVGL